MPRGTVFPHPDRLGGPRKIRSVPTATAGEMPRKKMSAGVIRDPPPTPVMPTIMPTTNPSDGKKKIEIHYPSPADDPCRPICMIDV